MPNFDIHLTPDEEHLECLRPDGHDEEHLVRLSDGRYIVWEHDGDCDCGEEDCQDFVWSEVPDKEAGKLIRHQSVPR
jgi:hypothetical protein